MARLHRAVRTACLRCPNCTPRGRLPALPRACLPDLHRLDRRRNADRRVLRLSRRLGRPSLCRAGGAVPGTGPGPAELGDGSAVSPRAVGVPEEHAGRPLLHPSRLSISGVERRQRQRGTRTGCALPVAEITSSIGNLTPEIACEALRAVSLSCPPDKSATRPHGASGRQLDRQLRGHRRCRPLGKGAQPAACRACARQR